MPSPARQRAPSPSRCSGFVLVTRSRPQSRRPQAAMRSSCSRPGRQASSPRASMWSEPVACPRRRGRRGRSSSRSSAHGSSQGRRTRMGEPVSGRCPAARPQRSGTARRIRSGPWCLASIETGPAILHGVLRSKQPARPGQERRTHHVTGTACALVFRCPSALGATDERVGVGQQGLHGFRVDYPVIGTSTGGASADQSAGTQASQVLRDCPLGQPDLLRALSDAVLLIEQEAEQAQSRPVTDRGEKRRPMLFLHPSIVMHRAVAVWQMNPTRRPRRLADLCTRPEKLCSANCGLGQAEGLEPCCFSADGVRPPPADARAGETSRQDVSRPPPRTGHSAMELWRPVQIWTGHRQRTAFGLVPPAVQPQHRGYLMRAHTPGSFRERDGVCR